MHTDEEEIHLPDFKDQVCDRGPEDAALGIGILPSFKGPVRTAASGPAASSGGGKETASSREPAAAANANFNGNANSNDDGPSMVPLAEGQLVVEPDETSNQGSAKGHQPHKDTTGPRKHAIWAVALVCIAVVLGVIVAVVLTVGGGDGDGDGDHEKEERTAETKVIVYYVQVFLSPATGLLSGGSLDAFEEGTDEFYEETLPEGVLSTIESRLVDQYLLARELAALVQVNSTTIESIDQFDPTLLSDAISDNPSEYIEKLRAQAGQTFANVSAVRAMPAAPPTSPPEATTAPVSLPIGSPPVAAVPPTAASGNDVCENAVTVAPRDDDPSAVVVGSTVGANPAPTETNLYNGGPVVYYKFTTEAGLSRRIRVSTCTAETDFETGVYVSDSTCGENILRFIDWSSNKADLQCEFGLQAATVSFVAKPTTTYRIAVAGRTPNESGSFGLSVTRFIEVDNDECDNAELLVAKDDEVSPLVVGSTELAQRSGDSDRFNNAPVVYYRFSIAGLNRRVQVSTCGPDTNFPTEIFISDSTCDKQGARFIDFRSAPDFECDSSGMSSTISFVAQADTVYRVAVAGRLLTDKGSFSLSLTRFFLLPNDECHNAALITLKDDDMSTLLTASTDLAQPAGDRFNGSPIIYYQFSVTGLARRVRISTCGETNFATAIYVSDSTCDQQGARFIDFTSEPDFGCDSSGNAASVDFVAVPETTYRFGIAGRLPTDSGTFGLTLTKFALIENDECDNALTILPNDNDPTPLLAGSTELAQPAGNDRFNNSPIVYYQFTAEVGLDRSIRLSTCASETNFDTVIYVADSSCDRQGLRFIDSTSEPDFSCDPSGKAATVEFVAASGKTYRFGVSGRLPNDIGSFGLSAYYLPQ